MRDDGKTPTDRAELGKEKDSEIMKTKKTTRKLKQAQREESHSFEQARAQLVSIRELVGNKAQAKPDSVEYENALEAIQQDPLEVAVRSGWVAPAGKINGQTPEEFKILLCTGGPAVQIVGELTEHGEPEKPRLQHQDWGTPWTDYPLTSEDEENLLAYCREFYFGE